MVTMVSQRRDRSSCEGRHHGSWDGAVAVPLPDFRVHEGGEGGSTTAGGGEARLADDVTLPDRLKRSNGPGNDTRLFNIGWRRTHRWRQT